MNLLLKYIILAIAIVTINACIYSVTPNSGQVTVHCRQSFEAAADGELTWSLDGRTVGTGASYEFTASDTGNTHTLSVSEDSSGASRAWQITVASDCSACAECPQWIAPSPGWCADGTIIPGDIDDCNCQGPPTCVRTGSNAASSDTPILNGTQFRDTDGNVMHTHGGSLLNAKGYFYWYGEHRYSDFKSQGISCYRSTDLINWEYRGDILTDRSAGELSPSYMERPKVIYNAHTDTYVLWFHWENGQHYGEARAAVAYGNSPEGRFTYQGSFRPLEHTGYDDPGDSETNFNGSPRRPGYMSRDCTLFVDDDGSAYFLSTWKENRSLNLYKLTADYRHIESLVATLFDEQRREAPCLFKRNGYYYLVTSGLSGWNPNQGKWSYSRRLDRGWSPLMNFGDATTYRSQPAFIFAVQGTTTTSYLYTGDRWGPAWGASVADSQYIWLPIRFNSPTSIALDWYDTITLNARTGEINGSNSDIDFSPGNIYLITNQATQKVLEVKGQSKADGAAVVQWGGNGGDNQRWRFEDAGNGYYEIINVNSGKLLGIKNEAAENGADADQWSNKGSIYQQWQIISVGDGNYKLQNRGTNKLLGIENGSTADGAVAEQWTDGGWTSQQWRISRI